METASLLLLIIPNVLLLLYVVIRHVAKHTKSTLDDEIADATGELLEGMGHSVPTEHTCKKADQE